MFLHALHIHLQSCKEHNIIESHPAKKFKGVVAFKNIETILSNHYTRQHHTDDVRNTQLTHHNWRKEDDQQHHKEDQCRVSNRQI